MNRTEILHNACELIEGDRKASYGDAEEAYTRLAKIWSGILGHDVTPVQVLLCLAGMKLQRAAHRGADDDFVDGAAYFALAGEVAGK